VVAVAVPADRLADAFRGAHGGGALFDDQLAPVERAGDGAGDPFDLGEVGAAIVALGRADADEHDLGLRRGSGNVWGEAEAPASQATLKQFLGARLVKGHAPGGDLAGFVGVVVHAEDFPAQLGKTERRGQADVAETYHRNLHFGLRNSDSGLDPAYVHFFPRSGRVPAALPPQAGGHP
jgi:hypothetical protein